ncbi:MAG: alpha/beta fold hydrolase [Cyanobacteriota bacterium]|nr:alpha/beta fold hydrolase [Cyanobacteriota bacterium]
MPTPSDLFVSEMWSWRGQPIHYLSQGINQGSGKQAVLLVHGFGASSLHWRKNISVVAQHYPVYAIDLLGFGRSAKPNLPYRTEMWRDQLRDFCQQVIRRPVVVVGNSLGGYVGLSLASDWPEWVRGVVLLNSAGSFGSQPQANLWKQMTGGILRWGLQQKVVSHLLFYSIRKPEAIRKTLLKVYRDPAAVTDQLVEDIYRPSCEAGAADVFAALMQANQKGRSVDELLRSLVRPLLLIWGEADPWMDCRQRSQLYHQHYQMIEEHFLSAGHCPHDEVPELVNPLLCDWIEKKVLHTALLS